MKKAIVIILIGFMCIFLSACEMHTIIDFESKEIPYQALPADISQDVIKKYRVGKALILPSIQHVNVGRSSYLLQVEVFSEEKTDIIIKSILFEMDEDKIEYGEGIAKTKFPPLEYSDKFKCYYSKLRGDVLVIPNPKNIKRIDVTLVVEVLSGRRDRVGASIKTTFFPKSRTYLE